MNKFIFTFAALTGASLLMDGQALAAFLDCPNCNLIQSSVVASPLAGAGTTNQKTISEGIDITRLLSGSYFSPLQFNQAQSYTLTEAKPEDFGPLLPGAFKPGPNEYRTGFETTYYDPIKGPLDVVSAPWNIYNNYNYEFEQFRQTASLAWILP